MLFIASGRVNVMVATPPETAYVTGEVSWLIGGLSLAGSIIWESCVPPDALVTGWCAMGDNGLHLTLRPARNAGCRHETRKRCSRMAAMKPRTGDGPMEVTKEGRGIVMRVPLEGGGRLVVELNAEEAAELGGHLQAVVA
jgi:hypothetical protein